MPHIRLFIFVILAVVFAVNHWVGEPAMMRGFWANTLGGPLFAEEGAPAEPQSAYSDVVSPSNQALQDTSFDDPPVYFADTVGGIANPSNDAPRWMPGDADILEHIVADGDTLSSIAQKYGVSVETVIWANKLTANSIIKPGDTFEFPSVSGVLHRVTSGETISGIASRYGVSQDWILAANDGLNPESLRDGAELIVPGGRPTPSQSASQTYSPPLRISSGNVNTLGYFMAPTIGTNWGRRHFNNAVDIANTCGTPVWAAADGIVTWTGWNGSYGNLVRISHPNGTETGYAHLSKISVSVGAPVSQGDVIGFIGNTGRVRGVTGCHVHFEVVGGTNPFIRYR